MRTHALYASIDRAWEGSIRPALRAHFAHVESVTGTRPAPGEVFVIVGAAADVTALVTVPLAADRADVPVACVGERAYPAALVVAPLAPLVAELCAGYPSEALVVLWVSPDDVDVVALDVIDTGAEGARINAEGGFA